MSPENPPQPGSSERFVSVIAIDGPVASGKSSIGRRVAEKLGGYRFVDTGMMYRAVTWLALKDNTELPDEETLAEMARGASIRLERGDDGSPVLYLNKEDVTPLTSETMGTLRSMWGARR